MADYIVAVDAGNGFTNAVRTKGRGYESIGFPSVRASVSGDSLGLGEQFEMNVDYVQWSTFRYAVGDDVFTSRRAIERHQGAFRYGDEFWLFLVSVALGKLLPKKGGSVDLTVFAPPSMFFDAQAGINERMKTIKNTMAVQFKGDNKPRVFTIEKITVHPEGLGAVGAFALNNKGQTVETDILDGETVVLDLGMYTLDALSMSNGQFNPESLQSATWEGQGIKTHILDNVLRVVKKQGEDFSLLTTDDIDQAMRKGLSSGDFTLVSGASAIDIEAAVKKFAQRYADWIANNIIDGVFNSLRGIKSLILVGGGATLTAHHLKTYYSEKLLQVEQHDHVADVLPTELNAVGGVRLAVARQTT